MAKPKVIILGGGVAAIAMAHTLKWKLGLSNFIVSLLFSSRAGDFSESGGEGGLTSNFTRYTRSAKVPAAHG